jgi:Spy/CpxP family protein refolding chaperone
MMFDHLPKTFGAAAMLLGAALLVAPMPTMAQSAPAAAPAAKHMSRTDRIEAQITHLHTQLKITPAESAEWDAVAAAMRSQGDEMRQLAEARHAKRGSMTAVDDLKNYQAITAAHAAELDKLVPAFEALYAKMSPDQQQNADVVFGHRPGHKAKKAG